MLFGWQPLSCMMCKSMEQLADLESSSERLEPSDDDEEAFEVRSAIRERQMALRRHADRHGVGRYAKVSSKDSPKQLLEELGPNKDRWLFELADQMVHGTEAALFSYRIGAENQVGWTLRATSVGAYLGAAAFACRSAVRSTRAFSTLAGVGLPLDIGDLEGRAELLDEVPTPD